jgi:hypothetical protein
MRQVVGDFTSNILLGLDLSGRDSFAVRTARMRDQLCKIWTTPW